MNADISEYTHPVPVRYHGSLYIGEHDRRGNLIDFKGPPVVVVAPRSIAEYRRIISAERAVAEELPMTYAEGFSFLVLRPAALPYRSWLREEIEIQGLPIRTELEICNFVRFSDVLYLFDPNVKFHWQWRVIMQVLHESGTQDQNHAVAFVLDHGEDRVETHRRLVTLKKSVRQAMGETPVIVKSDGVVEIALGIHHVHVPEFERVAVEYNALMHACNKTSIFAQ